MQQRLNAIRKLGRHCVFGGNGGDAVSAWHKQHRRATVSGVRCEVKIYRKHIQIRDQPGETPVGKVHPLYVDHASHAIDHFLIARGVEGKVYLLLHLSDGSVGIQGCEGGSSALHEAIIVPASGLRSHH
jgi:hypothetical protein